ncbi:class I SAM-dependent methyltransferase [Pontivivens insulae]|uniref:Ribosomal RNA small subunit methyltransferase C n=1 Tax=Pontivivens insulae TaxID=1639689 RepID=A0A2R8ADW0_9RHOB|nr:methyltransferase [Pontivivens insulae]RED14332.1 16S rRNA m(2)G 1207 methyltransferase [Pontivivens insulae]SPF30409.1 Ribosomal RNA small subunit methyltransferase C [Pontivivens insulae]
MSDAARLNYALGQGLLLPEGPMLAIRPTASPEWREHVERLECLQSFKPDHDALASLGLRMVQEVGATASALVCLTRSREESLANIAAAWSALPERGLLLISGEKKQGADAIFKSVRKVAEVDGSTSKAHGRLFWITVGATRPDVLADWHAAGQMRRNGAGYLTAPGMFSPDKVDAGSQLLADAFAGELKGDVADLGAGWGWLSAAALTSSDKIDSIKLIEAEKLSLNAAQQNIDDARASFEWGDATALPARRVFDTVISNPPFHKTRAADPELGRAFIASAARVLKSSGTFWMVANRQLPYESALETHFQRWEELPGNGAFKLFRARRPRS